MLQTPFAIREKKKQQQAQMRAVGTFGGSLLGIFFAGWLLSLVWNAFTPESFPYMGLWTAFGISYIFSYVVAKVRGD